MSAPRLLPHRVLPEGSVNWGRWFCARANGEPMPIPGSFQDWDEAEHLVVGAEPTEVEESALQACLGASTLRVLLVGVVDCRATQKRFVTTEVLQDGAASVRIELPAGQLAGQITLTQHLVLGAPQAQVADRHSPKAVGSRLAASDPVTVHLDGGPTQFPTEALSFRKAGLEPVPWKLQVDASDLEAPFLGAVRLWVNTDHPAGRALLDPSHPQFKALTSVVKRETIAHLIGSVPVDLLNDRESDDDADPDSFLSAVSLLSDIWVGTDLSDALQLLHHDPVDFWTRTARRTKLLEDLS